MTSSFAKYRILTVFCLFALATIVISANHLPISRVQADSTGSVTFSESGLPVSHPAWSLTFDGAPYSVSGDSITISPVTFGTHSYTVSGVTANVGGNFNSGNCFYAPSTGTGSDITLDSTSSNPTVSIVFAAQCGSVTFSESGLPSGHPSWEIDFGGDSFLVATDSVTISPVPFGTYNYLPQELTINVGGNFNSGNCLYASSGGTSGGEVSPDSSHPDPSIPLIFTAQCGSVTFSASGLPPGHEFWSLTFDGVPFSVSGDSITISPVTLSGPFTGTHTYVYFVAGFTFSSCSYSPSSGTGTGGSEISLDSTNSNPVVSIAFTSQCPPMDMKTAVLADLTALRSSVTGKNDGHKIDEAIDHLKRSLDPALWQDDNHLNPDKGKRVFEEEKQTVQKLVELINDKDSTLTAAQKSQLQGFVNRLVAADNTLANTAIQDATAHDGKPNKLSEANAEFIKANQLTSTGNYAAAIEQYANAWQSAELATKL